VDQGATLDGCRKFCPQPGFEPRNAQSVVRRNTDHSILATMMCTLLFSKYLYVNHSYTIQSSLLGDRYLMIMT